MDGGIFILILLACLLGLEVYHSSCEGFVVKIKKELDGVIYVIFVDIISFVMLRGT